VSQAKALHRQPAPPTPESRTPGRTDGPKRPGHQPWCREVPPKGAQVCPRCKAWQPGNSSALTTGAYSARRAAALESAMREVRAKVLKQVGRTERTIAPVKSIVVDCLAREYFIASGYFAYLATRPNSEEGGHLSVTTKGRVSRAANAHGNSVDRIIKLAQLLGLDEVARRTSRATPFHALRSVLEGGDG
jgi:hypothetical protein